MDRSENDTVLAVVAKHLHKLLAGLVQRECRFFLLWFPPRRAHWVIAGLRADESEATTTQLLRDWYEYFKRGEKRNDRSGNEFEARMAAVMEKVARLVEDVLTEATGHGRFILVVFPDDAGMYASNITRESARKALAECFEELERAHSKAMN